MKTLELSFEEAVEVIEGAKYVGSFSPLALAYGDYSHGGTGTPTEETKAFFHEETNMARIVTAFHAHDYYPVEAHDDILGNIRANHFILELGWTEEAYSIDTGSIILVTGNHKGARCTDVYILPIGEITEEPEYF